MGRRQALRRDRLDELVHRLLRAFRLRPSDGQGADGANRESKTNCPEHLSLPLLGATGCADETYPREIGLRADVLTITKRSKAVAG